MLLRQRRFSTEARPAAVNAAAAGVRGFVRIGEKMVPLAGIEPALLAELDFESSASTSSATGAFATACDGRLRRPRSPAKRADYSGRPLPVNSEP